MKKKGVKTHQNNTDAQDTVNQCQQAEESFRHREERYRNILDHMEEAYFEVDLKGNLTFFNATAVKNLGYTDNEMMGMNFRQYVGKDYEHKVFEAFHKVFLTGESVKGVDWEVISKAGEKKPVESSITLMQDTQGNPIGFRGIIRDITERKQIEEKLRREEQRFRAFMEHSSDIVVILNREGTITYVNPAVERILGLKVEERIGASGFERVHPDDMKFLADAFNTLARDINTPILQSEMRLLHKDGSWRTFEAVGSNLVNNNAVEAVIVNYRDITKRKLAEKKLRESEENYRQLFDHSPAAIYRIDFKNGRVLKANDLFCEYFGCSQEEITSLSLYDFLTEESKKQFLERVEKMALGVEVPETVEYEGFDKKGKRWCLQLHNKNIYDAEGHVVASDVVAHDITERKRAEEALRKSEQKYLELSISDDLTQLYNSRHFYAQLEREIERSNRYEQPLTLLLLDLDKFKEFNDTYGHVEGDYVLSRLGQIIKRCLRETDSAYRYGGEEFTIILPMTTSEEGMVTAKRIQTELRKEYFSPVLDQKINVTVSIGLTQYRLKEEIKAFVNRVDKLMYQAKKNGRDRICPES